MQLVERHLMRPDDPRFAAIDTAAFASKNLYNQANYQIRQAYFHEGKYLPYAEIFHRLKTHEAYCALPRKVSNSILIQLHKNWTSFFEAREAYQDDPTPFTGRPKLPGYKDKEKGRNILIYDKQALGKRAFKKSGKPLKNLNQYYNQQRAHHQQRLSHENRFTSRKLDQVTTKRNRRVDTYLHTASRRIIDLLVSEGIGTLVVGKNPLWKQEANMGSKNNQQFVQIPHARFIDQLTYKAKLVGIIVLLQEESYSSKASFLDGDPIPTYDHSRAEKPVFSGKRIARSWYRASNGQVIHADINGSYNILRKSSSDPLQVGRGVVGAAVHPRRLAV